jgi:hypothetical protein
VQEVLKHVTRQGLRTRRGRPVWSQKFGEILRNPLYMGLVSAPDYGIDGQRGDFAPLVSENVFYRVQAVLQGRAPALTPHFRSRPDFPLRGFVRCHSCGRGLTASRRQATCAS